MVRLHAWRGWLAGLVCTGFALGCMVALATFQWRAQPHASVHTMPPAMPASAPGVAAKARTPTLGSAVDARTATRGSDLEARAWAPLGASTSGLARAPLFARAPEGALGRAADSAVREAPIRAPLRAPNFGVSIQSRRAAVDALLAGHTRAALEQYQRLLAAPPPELADADAMAQLAKLLQRELRTCEREAGTPCGF